MGINCTICRHIESVKHWGIKDGYELVRCINCNYIFVNPIPTQEQLDRHYSKQFYDDNYNPESETEIYKQRSVQYGLDRELLFDFSDGGNALDYGCGNGEFLPNIFTKYGYDPAVNSDESAGKNLRLINPEMCGDGFFDVIVMRGVIEHLIDPKTIVSDLTPKLKRNGIFFISATPNSDSPAMLIYGARWKLVTPPFHLHYFNPRNLALMFGRLGYSLLHIEYPYMTTPYKKESDGEKFLRALSAYHELRGMGESPAYPGSMMSLVFKKL